MGAIDYAPETGAAAVLAGGGEMGALMRGLDWASTPLGPIEGWPQSLRTVASVCLSSRFPLLLLWGPELVMLYNDAFRPILGTTKHPAALGQRAVECWPEVWHVVGPMLLGVLATGQAIWSDDLLLLLDRNGYVEECYFTFSYSPIRGESGGVGGVFTAVTETTGRVLGERRLRTLRELAARTAEASSVEDVCAAAVTTLATNAADLPFAALYLPDAPWDWVLEWRLVDATGIDAGLPETMDLAAPAVSQRPDGAWAVVLEAGNALVLPVTKPGQDQPAALLVAGVSPRRTLDDDYRGFFGAAGRPDRHRARHYPRPRGGAQAGRGVGGVGPRQDRLLQQYQPRVPHPADPGTRPGRGGAGRDARPRPPPRERLELAHRSHLRLLKLVNTLLDFAADRGGSGPGLLPAH